MSRYSTPHVQSRYLPTKRGHDVPNPEMPTTCCNTAKSIISKHGLNAKYKTPPLEQKYLLMLICFSLRYIFVHCIEIVAKILVSFDFIVSLQYC